MDTITFCNSLERDLSSTHALTIKRAELIQETVRLVRSEGAVFSADVIALYKEFLANSDESHDINR